MQFFFATAFGRFAPERNYRRGKGLFDCTYFQNYTKAIKIKKCGGFGKQLELKKFKLFFLCIMHKEEGEENDKPRVVQSKQKEIM